MEIHETSLPGVFSIRPKIFGDERGFFVETWQKHRYQELGLPDFVQDNLSFSKKGVLRGLHFQNPYAQGKLVTVLQGEVFDVAVDIRVGSPYFGKWTSVILTGKNKQQFYVPPGFAHGFQVLSEEALFSYKCSEIYHPETECSLRWDDPTIDIDWPLQEAQLSEKDLNGFRLDAIDPLRLPQYHAALG